MVDLTVPDTITNWIGGGYCLSQEHGLGVANQFNMKVFQPFFVSMSLPYSVIRGEDIPLKLTIFNYLDKCLVVCITISTQLRNYNLIGHIVHTFNTLRLYKFFTIKIRGLEGIGYSFLIPGE